MERMHKTVYLAGGCFWGIEAYLKSLFGVQRVRSGYANGKTKNPNYKEVVTGETGFVETVEVVFDPVIMPLAVLISHFFRIIDPTTLNRQGNDIGTQYRTGLYYCDPSDRELLQKMLHLLQKDQKKPIVVELLPIENFYPAEEYHQDYLAKNPFGYCHIDLSLVDERFIPKYPYLLDNVEEKRRALSGKKRFIGCEQGTEPPFSHPLWKFSEPGVYVDIASAQPLFLSVDKFDSGCGWPSFHTPASEDVLITREDRSHGMVRMEVLSALSKLHLGHVFSDGPREHGGRRYCINGEMLRFVPLHDMDREGYGYLRLYIKEEED